MGGVLRVCFYKGTQPEPKATHRAQNITCPARMLMLEWVGTRLHQSLISSFHAVQLGRGICVVTVRDNEDILPWSQVTVYASGPVGLVCEQIVEGASEHLEPKDRPIECQRKATTRSPASHSKASRSPSSAAWDRLLQ